MTAGILALLTQSSCGADSDSKTLPFGLGSLHWKMNREEATRAFAPLGKPTYAGPDAKLKDELRVDIKGYDWQSCQLEIRFFFAKSGLNEVSMMEPSGSQTCSERILNTLQSTYGSWDAKERSNESVSWARSSACARFFWLGQAGVFVWLWQPKQKEETATRQSGGCN